MYNKHMQVREERGAVSIFIVIFFALLIAVITISFISIVTRDTVQSANNDLSRSAYDSAEAGIEDAKRAIALYTSECNTGGANCTTYGNYLNDQTCHALPDFASSLGIIPSSGTEIPVQSATNSTFDQAYTCVKVHMNTPDYINSKQDYESDVIPLLHPVTPAGLPTSADGVSISWFTHSDGGIPDTASFNPRPPCSVTATAISGCDLPKQGAWGPNSRPALLRVELISYAASGPITDADLQNNAKTLFLYPSKSGTLATDFDQDVTPPSAGSKVSIIPVKCSTGSSVKYACTVSIGFGSNAGKNSFLRVTPIYKATTFDVSLTGASTPQFNGVQPLVDSTGRANDLFRRVQARVRVQNTVTYPEFAADVDNTLCKDYAVGASPQDFITTNKCP